MIHLDTHVVVWLYAGQVERFPADVLALIDDSALYISPMVLLEMELLHEIGRITEGAETISGDLSLRIGLQVSREPFSAVVEQARGQTWTRDPFDRLIVGQAIVESARLLTKDRRIHEHFSEAYWA